MDPQPIPDRHQQPPPVDPSWPAEAVAAELAGLDSAPTATHVAAFERVHAALTEALSAIDGV